MKALETVVEALRAVVSRYSEPASDDATRAFRGEVDAAMRGLASAGSISWAFTVGGSQPPTWCFVEFFLPGDPHSFVYDLTAGAEPRFVCRLDPQKFIHKKPSAGE